MRPYDSWRAPDAISEREASGSSAGGRAAWPRFWTALEPLKRQKRTGATPKGQRRPVRPTTAGGRQTPFLTGRPREATQEFVQLGQVFGRRRSRQKGKKWAGTTPKGQGRPVRPTTAGGHRRHPGAGGFLMRLSRCSGDKRLFGMLLRVKKGQKEKREAKKGRRRPVRQDKAGGHRRHKKTGGFGKQPACDGDRKR